MNTPNWKNLTGDALNKVVAERIGYRVVSLNDNPFGYIVKTMTVYFLAPPEMRLDDLQIWHKIMAGGNYVLCYDDPARAWANMNRNWAGDLNHAITLWTDDYRWGLCPSDDIPGQFSASFPGWNGDQDAGWVTEKSPATGICYAWLSWKDAKSK